MAFLAIPLITIGTTTVLTVGSVVGLAVSVGLSLAARALTPKPKKRAAAPTQDAGGFVQTSLSVDPSRPRSFLVGLHPTAGSLVYATTHGNKNEYLEMVVALSDLPIDGLAELWVNGKRATLAPGPTGDLGIEVMDYRGPGGGDNAPPIAHLWLRLYDGRQTAADPRLVSVSKGEWEASAVGTNVAYAAITALYHPEVFPSGIPQFKFVLRGSRLYDPRKDSTVGGEGGQRLADPATWAWTDNAYVIKYNLMLGCYAGTQWLFGPNMPPASLPLPNWVAAMNIASEIVSNGSGGFEARYRVGAEIMCEQTPADVFQDLLKASAGRLYDVGGVVKAYPAAAYPVVMAFTDDDIMADGDYEHEPRRPFDAAINTVTGSYLEPAEGWSTKPLAPRSSAADIIADGGRRRVADYALDMVSSQSQGERVLEIYRKEARREARHRLPMPPEFLQLEPGDWVSWTSAEFGYVAKTFRVALPAYQPDLGVDLTLEEVDGSDYGFGPGDYNPVQPSPLPPAGVAVAVVTGFTLDGVGIEGADGTRIPALLAGWQVPLDPTVQAYLIQYREAPAGEIMSVTIANVGLGQAYITAGIAPQTLYQARAIPIVRPERSRAYTEWLVAMRETPPAIYILQPDAVDFDALTAQVRHDILQYAAQGEGTLRDALARLKAELERLAADVSLGAATDYQARELVRVSLGEALAAISTETSLRTTNEEAVAKQITAMLARFGSNEAALVEERQVRATADSALSSSITALSTTVGQNTATLTTQGQSIDGFKVQYSVTGTINGQTGGFTFQGVKRMDGSVSFGLSIHGDVLISGTVTAPKMNVQQLAAITTDTGLLRTGRMLSLNGKTDFDLNATRLAFYN